MFKFYKNVKITSNYFDLIQLNSKRNFNLDRNLILNKTNNQKKQFNKIRFIQTLSNLNSLNFNLIKQTNILHNSLINKNIKRFSSSSSIKVILNLII